MQELPPVAARSKFTDNGILVRNKKLDHAVQRLLGPAKLESTVRYLGIGVDDALERAEQTEV